MDKIIIKKFRWFWAWQDEAEEAWLGEMSRKGYHLTSAGLPGIYTFNKGEPRDYVYRLDYKSFYKKDKQEYLQLFEDAGWEYLDEMSGWQYFRKEARPGELTEIFTDVESKIAKYKNILIFLGIIYVSLFINSVLVIFRINPYPWWAGVQAIFLIILVFFIYAIIRLLMRIRQLKKL